jgi:hypothetical protein
MRWIIRLLVSMSDDECHVRRCVVLLLLPFWLPADAPFTDGPTFPFEIGIVPIDL